MVADAKAEGDGLVGETLCHQSQHIHLPGGQPSCRWRHRGLRPLRRCYLLRIVPRIDKLLQSGQEMFPYLPLSTVDYPDQERLRQIMEQSGFTNVKVREFLFGASVIHLAYKPEAG